MQTFKEHVELQEGANDPAIFKAIFLAGGPGSGKSFTVGKTALPALGFRVVNSDDAYEVAMKKAGKEMNPENIFSDEGQVLRGKSKKLTNLKLSLYIEGRLGLVIDGTGRDYAAIKKQANDMKALGYEVSMIFVNTDVATAVERDANRTRTVGAELTTKLWGDVQSNLGKFQAFFESNFFIVDNSIGSNLEKGSMRVYKKMMSWSKSPPVNHLAKKWIDSQKKNINEKFKRINTSEKMATKLGLKIQEIVDSENFIINYGGMSGAVKKLIKLGFIKDYTDADSMIFSHDDAGQEISFSWDKSKTKVTIAIA